MDTLNNDNNNDQVIAPNFPQLLAQFRANPRSLLGQVPGIFLYDKPTGMTSFEVVRRLRQKNNWQRIGHGGTLDPLATGLLTILVGNATRLFDELHLYDKEYLATFTLGIQTDTLDISGKTINTDESPNREIAEVEKALNDFRGVLQQVPPMYSALKKHGQKLVDLARQGIVVDREPRTVKVSELELINFDGTNGTLRIVAGKGFYVRTLIDDIGLRLNTYACMTQLRRTKIAMFSVDEAQVLI